jgi:hypothetical protein
MAKRILVITDPGGLSQNLLKLALNPWKKDVIFSGVQPFPQEHLAAAKWIILDQRVIDKINRAEELLGDLKNNQQVIYLTDEEFPLESRGYRPQWIIIKKPFNPKQLRDLIE